MKQDKSYHGTFVPIDIKHLGSTAVSGVIAATPLEGRTIHLLRPDDHRFWQALLHLDTPVIGRIDDQLHPQNPDNFGGYFITRSIHGMPFGTDQDILLVGLSRHTYSIPPFESLQNLQQVGSLSHILYVTQAAGNLENYLITGEGHIQIATKDRDKAMGGPLVNYITYMRKRNQESDLSHPMLAVIDEQIDIRQVAVQYQQAIRDAFGRPNNFSMVFPIPLDRR